MPYQDHEDADDGNNVLHAIFAAVIVSVCIFAVIYIHQHKTVEFSAQSNAQAGTSAASAPTK